MKIFSSFFGAITLLAAASFLQSCRQAENNKATFVKKFNDGWEFVISSDSSCIFSAKTNSAWQKVKLPHTPVIEPLIVNDQWQGISWYRKDFFLGSDMEGKQLFMKFEGAMNVAEVWINGVKKIRHPGGYLPFVVDFTHDARINDTNQVIVRLDNTDNPVTGPKPLKKLDFNTYGGLYRDVSLIAKNSVFITDPVWANKPGSGGMVVTYVEVTKERALIRVKTHVMNAGDKDREVMIRQELLKGKSVMVLETSPPQQIKAGNDIEVFTDLTVPSPDLWSPSSPYLYDLVTLIISDDRVVDTDTTTIGIRRFDIRKDYFAINGEKMFLRGVNRHQEYP